MRRPAAAGVVAAGVAAVAAIAAPAPAQTLLTQEEALELAFPAPVAVERRTAYLSDAELERARTLAGEGVEIETGVVSYYVGLRDGEPMGAAYFDAHRVRTKNEVAMVVVGPDAAGARVRRVDVLKFTEPPEYQAPEGWIEQLEGRKLDDELSTRRGIRNLTGATLTARALTEATRRVLALHAVIAPFGDGDSPGGGSPGGAR
ncbi:MAG: FMN-binding protein [Longimicrobiales bacterium]